MWTMIMWTGDASQLELGSGGHGNTALHVMRARRRGVGAKYDFAMSTHALDESDRSGSNVTKVE